MAGLYIHIPFCKQACHYCNFHFSTSLQYKADMVNAILKELEMQQQYLPDNKLQTIYLGGGTPSLLDENDLDILFTKINVLFEIEPDAEITLEANPDDLTSDKLKMLAQSPVNRLSIGIQSFFDNDLNFMNRAHNAKEARHCIGLAKKNGFNQLSIDLIYGAPTTSDEQWEKNLALIFDYNISHISCYCLTVEEGTALHHFITKGKVPAVNEERAAHQFEILMSAMKTNSYIHYEISNFAKPDCFARHNTNYWLGKPYLGVGPSAHSFDGISRQWNIANNAKYMKAIAQNQLPFEKEILSSSQQYNEYIMTSLRTIWGCDPNKIILWGDLVYKHFETTVKPHLKNKTVCLQNGNCVLTEKGKLLADKIAMDLFLS